MEQSKTIAAFQIDLIIYLIRNPFVPKINHVVLQGVVFQAGCAWCGGSYFLVFTCNKNLLLHVKTSSYLHYI